MVQRILGICVGLLAATVVHAQTSRSTGLVFLEDAAYRSIPLAAMPLLGEIPAAVDLAERFPRPGDQGQQSSCVGWAVAYALKSYQENVERNWRLDTPAAQFSPAFIYNQINTTKDCKGGTRFVDALNLVRRDGAATLAMFPYREDSCAAVPDASIKQAARPYAIADWRRVNVQDELEVKTQIASGFPVLVGMAVDTAFMQLRGEQPYGEFRGPARTGHAMVLIGYNDARSAFKLINSWGTGWGSGGYGWVSYAAFREAAREGYVAQDIVPVPQPARPEPKPVTDPSPGPTPPRDPQPTYAPAAQIGAVRLEHNVTVGSPTGPVVGMNIYVPAEIRNAAGQTAQIVVKFNYVNGPPLLANQQEGIFRDIGGLVATGTAPRTIGSAYETLGNQPITLPYYALNFQPTNGLRNYDLTLTAYLFIGNTIAAQSPPVNFGLRW